MKHRKAQIRPAKKNTNLASTVASLTKQMALMKASRPKEKKTLGQKIGSGVGGFLGGLAQKALMTLTGMGDYKVHKNSLYVHALSGSPPPSFRADNHSIRVVHREYIGDVRGAPVFTQRFKFPINPSTAPCFPWLANLATQFEEYRFHGLVFEFKSTSGSAISSTNAALGTILMGTQYNVYAPDFQSKVQMDAYEYTVTTKPDVSALHPVECDPKLNSSETYFVDNSSFSAGGDLRMTNMGNFYVYVIGQQADGSNLGELWVTYDVELIKPRLQNNSWSASEALSALYFVNGRNSSLNANQITTDMFRNIQLYPDTFNQATLDQRLVRPSQSNLRLAFGSLAGGDPNRIYFPPSFRGKFLLQFIWKLNVAIGIAADKFIVDTSTVMIYNYSRDIGEALVRQTNDGGDPINADNTLNSQVVPGIAAGTTVNATQISFQVILNFDGSSTADPVTGKSSSVLSIVTWPWSSVNYPSQNWCFTLLVTPVFL